MQSLERNLNKVARCGEPSYVWRAGQERRLRMILEAAGQRISGSVLENGCGVGMYMEHLGPSAGQLVGLEFDFERCQAAHLLTSRKSNIGVLCAISEQLPFPDQTFNLILSHEVLEHVQDDREAIREMARVLKPGGRIIIFVPNRGYPFETHGIYWKGRYIFGNIPLVNYLPRVIRNRLAPHVRVYSSRDLKCLFAGLPVHFAVSKVIFGGYDNLIARWPIWGKIIRKILHTLEKTPLQAFGLSHFWVVEKDAIN